MSEVCPNMGEVEVDLADAGKVDLLESGEPLDEKGDNPLFSAFRSCAR